MHDILLHKIYAWADEEINARIDDIGYGFECFAHSKRYNSYFIVYEYNGVLLFRVCPEDIVDKHMLREFPELDSRIGKYTWTGYSVLSSMEEEGC